MSLRVSLSFIRQTVVIGIALCLLVTGYSLLRYPAILLPLRVGIVFASVFLVVLLGYVIIAWRLTQSTDSDAAWIANHGLIWGIMTAGFWLIEIVAGNLFDPRHSAVQIIYFGSSVTAFALPFFAGIWGAKRSGTIRAGTLVGLWSGIVSGLLTFLSLMAVTYLFINNMLKDPQNILQFQGSGAPDLVTFVIGDSLAGATGHLVIGLILGPALGAIGGVIRQFLEHRKSTTAV
jgi:hypothetical protein